MTEQQREHIREYTAPAALKLIGTGMRIRVPHDGSQAYLVEGLPKEYFDAHPEIARRTSIPISKGVIQELIRTHQIHAVTEHQNGAKPGWRELGYDGDVADWYVMIQ